MLQKFGKELLRVTEILFCGCGLKFLSPLIGTNSKLVRQSHIEQSVTQVLTPAVFSLGSQLGLSPLCRIGADKDLIRPVCNYLCPLLVALFFLIKITLNGYRG